MQLSCAKIFRSCHMKVRKLMHQIGLLYHLYYLEEGTFCPFRTFSGGRHFLLPFRTHWSKTVIDKDSSYQSRLEAMHLPKMQAKSYWTSNRYGGVLEVHLSLVLILC